jgi:hypothetical protein
VVGYFSLTFYGFSFGNDRVVTGAGEAFLHPDDDPRAPVVTPMQRSTIKTLMAVRFSFDLEFAGSQPDCLQ